MAWLANPAAATLVSAGSAAVSTYAQSRNANKLANQGTDLGKLRREAEANGFNPLTVLRATGGQGFKQNVSMGSGALASASFFNAFAGLGQNIAQAKQAEATLKNTLASTANYTAQTRSLSSAAVGQFTSGPGKAGVSSVQAQQNVVQPIVPKIPAGASVPPEMYEQYPAFLGENQSYSSPMPAAAMIEEAYGDAMSWVYGPIKLVGDIYTTGVLSGYANSLKTGKTFGVNNPRRAADIKNSDIGRHFKPILEFFDKLPAAPAR